MKSDTNNRSANIQELLKRAEGSEMKRTLGATGLTLLGIGAIIGTGIFVLTGKAAADHAGPALTLSFVLAGLACAFAGLCYAEFASMIPVAGSAYTYAYATMGRKVAWVIGWALVLEYLFGAATVAVGWSAYLNSFLEGQGVNIPDAWLSSPFEGTGGVFNLPAALGIFAVTTLLVIGIKESTTFNNIAVFMKVSVVLAFILAGWAYIDTANWTPYIPEQITDPQTGHSKYGVWGIVTGAAHIFFAYIGFDAVSTAAQETKNPQRNLPIGILASLFICTLLYIIVTMVLTGIVPYTELGVKEPIALGIDRAGITWLSPLIKIGAIAGLSSVMLVMLMAQPRIFMNMSKDGMLPAIFGRIHPKFKTPAFTTILVGLVCATAAGFFPINELAEMVNIGTLLAFVIVCVGIILLRRSHPDIPRPFKVPLVPLVPILGALCCVGLMLGLSWKTWLALAIWQGIGLVIYFTYGQKHKRAGTN